MYLNECGPPRSTKEYQSLVSGRLAAEAQILSRNIISKESIMEGSSKVPSAGLACLVWPARLSPRQHLRQLPVRRSAQSVAADGQFGRLVFGFAVTEALGIFSLLMCTPLLFAV